MSRAIWKGAISFGLVHIPVELYSAVASDSLDLTMLDKRNFAPIGFRRYNKKTGKEVQWENIVKGYEYKKDGFVVLSEEDLKQANVESTQTIDIQSFVYASEVPLTYYEQPYYLTPGKGGDKVYALLRETLRKADKVAIAQIVIRTKQHLAALVTVGEAIILNTLRYSTEIRTTEELNFPAKTLKSAGITEKEIHMALSLVEGMTEEWKPDQYHDTYREDVLALVKKKIKSKQTKTITEPTAEAETLPKSAKIIDLVALLEQSLGKKAPAKTKSVERSGEKRAEQTAEKRIVKNTVKSTATTKKLKSKNVTPLRRKQA